MGVSFPGFSVDCMELGYRWGSEGVGVAGVDLARRWLFSSYRSTFVFSRHQRRWIRSDDGMQSSNKKAQEDVV